MKIEDYNFYLMIFCCLALIICLAFIINAILQLRIRKPAIIINDKGLEDNVSIAKAGFIDWKNITGCFVAKMSGVDQLFIMVKDHSEIMAKQAKFKKGMLSVPIQDHGTPIAIDLKLLNYSAEKLQKIIMKRKKGKG